MSTALYAPPMMRQLPAAPTSAPKPPMPVCHLMDFSLLFLLPILAGVSTVLLGETPMIFTMDTRLILLPFLGAMVMAWITMWMNPEPETRKVTAARTCIALFLGTLLPPLFNKIHPTVESLNAIPQALILLGGMYSAAAYILSRPFFRRMYEQADHNARLLANAAENKFAHVVGAVVAQDAKAVAKELRNTVVPSDTTLNRIADKAAEQATTRLINSPEAAKAAEDLAENVSTKVIEKLP